MKNGLSKLIAILLILSLLASMAMAAGAGVTGKDVTTETIAPQEPVDPGEETTEPEAPEIPTESEAAPSESEEVTEPGDETEEPTEPTEPGDETEEPTEPTEPGDETEEPTEPTEPGDETEEPTEPTEPGDETEEPTEPEKPEYVYPDDWSRPALMFAVENGILQGDQNYNLNPEKNITRVQMAAVLTRLLGAAETADLSMYTDIDPNAWYVKELSAAVAAGIFNGTSATTFAPDAPLTREQAMVVLSRAFGIATEDAESYKEFTDGDSVAEYARYAVGAMKELGLVNGYTDGTVKPQKTITRAEVAQLLYKLFDTIAGTPEEIPEEGRVLYRGTDPLPGELTVKGTLILANGTPKELNIENWNIEDTLVIRTQDGIDLDLSNLTAKRLVICAEGVVTSDIDRVWFGGKGVAYTGDATYIGSLLGSHSAAGNYESALIRGGFVAISGSAVDLELNPSCGVSLNNSCRSITTGQKCSVSLEGSCESAVLGNLTHGDFAGDCNSLTLKHMASASVLGSCETVVADEACTLEVKGDVDSLTAGNSAQITVGGNCTTADLAIGAQLTVGGNCDTVKLASGATADVTGNCTNAVLASQANITIGGNCETVTIDSTAKATIKGDCTTAKLSDRAYLGILGSCTTLTAGAGSSITINKDCTTATLGASAVLILGGASDSITMNGSSSVTVLGHAKLITMSEKDTLVLNGTADEIVVNKAYATLSGTGRAKLITIYDRGCDNTLAADTVNNIWYDTYGKDYESALSTVQTMRVACTVKENTFLCANQNLTNYLCALPKGAIVYNEWHPAGDVFKVSYTDANGKTWQGWTDRWACDIPDDTVTTNGKLDYSDATKEGWVDAKGYDSATEYLVWISRYTQKVIVFQGSKGNWKVIKTMPCSSGANNTPTPAGSFTIYSRTSRWDFTNYYTSNVSIFNGGHAFHSILINYDHTIYDDRVGIPLSHGCIRMLVEDCKYIYNLPMGTRVIVW